MTAPVNFYADFKGLAALKKDAKAQDPNALRETARQFEGLFTQMMLKTMRQASSSMTGGDALMGNDQSDMYREMFDNQMAMQLAKGRGLGLADMLVRQLTPGGAAAIAPTKPSTSALELRRQTDAVQLPLPARTPAAEPATTRPSTSVRPSETNGTPLSENIPGSVIPAKAGIYSVSDIQSMDPRLRGGDELNRVPIPLETASPWQQEWNSYLQSIGAEVPSSATDAAAKIDVLSTATASPIAASDEPQLGTSSSNEMPRPQFLAKDPADFVRQLWPYAQKAARELGVDAKTLIAHAALETGWGKFIPCNPDGSCSFNLFGIKANNRWSGQAVAVNTLEFEGGVAVKKQASFRSYDSPADSFRDYAAFLKNSPRYAGAVGAGNDAAAFADALQQGGYATDPNYATKLTSVAARMDSIYMVRNAAVLKFANNPPLSTGRSVSMGDET